MRIGEAQPAPIHTLSPVRAALGEAIAEMQRRERAVEDARKALDLARGNRGQVNQRLRQLREQDAEPTIDADAFIEGVRDGRSPTLADVADAARSEVAEEADLSRAASAWDETIQALAAALGERERAVGWGKAAVEGKRSAVLRDEAPALVGPLLDGLAALQSEVAARRTFLHILWPSLPADQQASLQSFLEAGPVLATTFSRPRDWANNPCFLVWKHAEGVLLRDPTVPLPTLADIGIGDT